MPDTETKTKTSGVVVPHAPSRGQRIGAWLSAAVIRTVSGTIRFRFEDRSGLFDGGASGPVVFCTWHNRLALSMRGYYGYVRKRKLAAGLAVMVSASRDGGFLSAILECFGVQPVRGSSSRRGPQALRELISWAEKGYDVAITPDGPRGPCYVVQDGVMSMAQLAGIPIVPVTYTLGWKVQLRSWDRFQIPLPFSSCQMILEKAIHVPRDASDAEREKLRHELETMMKNATRD